MTFRYTEDIWPVRYLAVTMTNGEGTKDTSEWEFPKYAGNVQTEFIM